MRPRTPRRRTTPCGGRPRRWQRRTCPRTWTSSTRAGSRAHDPPRAAPQHRTSRPPATPKAIPPAASSCSAGDGAAVRVVVGYDGSPTARAAVTHAVALAKGDRVVVVHAHHEPPARITTRWRELLSAETAEHGQAVLDAILLEGNDELAEANWEARLVEGPAAEALLRVADEVGADVVVTGSHGYG